MKTTASNLQNYETRLRNSTLSVQYDDANSSPTVTVSAAQAQLSSGTKKTQNDNYSTSNQKNKPYGHSVNQPSLYGISKPGFANLDQSPSKFNRQTPTNYSTTKPIQGVANQYMSYVRQGDPAYTQISIPNSSPIKHIQFSDYIAMKTPTNNQLRVKAETQQTPTYNKSDHKTSMEIQKQLQQKSQSKTQQILDTESEDYSANEDSLDEMKQQQNMYSEIKMAILEEENLRLQSQRSAIMNNCVGKAPKQSVEGQKKYGSVSSGILNRVLGENNSSRVLGLRPEDSLHKGIAVQKKDVTNQTFDKSCNQSQRQTPSSQINKKGLKTAQGDRLGPQCPTKDEHIFSMISTGTSSKTVVKSSQAFNGNGQSAQSISKVIDQHSRKQSFSGGFHSILTTNSVSQSRVSVPTDNTRNQRASAIIDTTKSYEYSRHQDEFDQISRVEDTFHNNGGSNNNVFGAIKQSNPFSMSQHQHMRPPSSNSNQINKSGAFGPNTFGVPSLLQTQKKGILNSTKKKKRKRSATKKVPLINSNPYAGLTNGPLQKFATPKEQILQNPSIKESQIVASSNGFHNTFAYETNKNSNIENDFEAQYKKKASVLTEDISTQEVSRQQFNIPLRTSSNNRVVPLIQQQAISTQMQQKKLLTQKSTSEKVQTNIITQPPIHEMNTLPNPPKKKQWTLLDSEKTTYGDRTPKGYEKLDILGRGGCALVWLARCEKTNEVVALKQFPKQKINQQVDSTAKVEVYFGRSLFPRSDSGRIENGVDADEFPGIESIAKLIDDIEEPKDYWLVYEVGSSCLSKHLYDVKGEFFKGERIYHVHHQPLYCHMKNDYNILRQFIRKMAEVYQVLTIYKIVHADIKPDNILIQYNGRDIQSIKLIDFGSSFSFENPSNIQASTPEYLSPEVLEYLEQRAQNTQANGTNSTNLCKKLQPWSYDVWSLGAIILEIMTGFPLWLSLKGRVTSLSGKSIVGTGLFGVQGRDPKKILAKQAPVIKNISQTLKKYDCCGLDRDPEFMDLLERMLDPNPLRRISPDEILEHPFIFG